MSKTWSWLKKNWMWLIAPVTIAVLVILYLMGWRPEKKDDVDSVTPDDAADQAVEDTNTAHDEREKAIKELEAEHREKLSEMTEEQLEEFEEVKKKPIDEVAAWIDSL